MVRFGKVTSANFTHYKAFMAQHAPNGGLREYWATTNLGYKTWKSQRHGRKHRSKTKGVYKVKSRGCCITTTGKPGYRRHKGKRCTRGKLSMKHRRTFHCA